MWLWACLFWYLSPLRQPITDLTDKPLDSIQFMCYLKYYDSSPHWLKLSTALLTTTLPWFPFAESTKRLSMRRKRTDPGKAKASLAWANAASWLRRRRENVKVALGKDDPDHGSQQHQHVRKLASSLWSEAHQKEKDRSLLQRTKKRYLALWLVTNFWSEMELFTNGGLKIYYWGYFSGASTWSGF